VLHVAVLCVVIVLMRQAVTDLMIKKNEFERARFYIQSDNCDICDVVAGDGAVSECERKTLSDYGCSYLIPSEYFNQKLRHKSRLFQKIKTENFLKRENIA